jgi:hypothetical protein
MEEEHSRHIRIRRKRKSKTSHLPRAKVNWIHILIATFIAISIAYYIIHRGPEEIAPQAYTSY